MSFRTLDARARLQSDGTLPGFRRRVRSCRRWQLSICRWFHEGICTSACTSGFATHVETISPPSANVSVGPHSDVARDPLRSWLSELVQPTPKDPGLVAIPIALFFGGSFVVLLLSFRETDGELRAAFAPIQLQCDERVAFAFD